MGLLPQSNARLLTITRGGTTEDYDSPAGSPITVWRGNWDAYVQQKIRSNFNDQGRLDRVLEVTLIIPADLPVQVEPGDIVTYVAGNADSPTTLAGRVQAFADPSFLPTLSDYYTIALEEVNVP